MINGIHSALTQRSAGAASIYSRTRPVNGSPIPPGTTRAQPEGCSITSTNRSSTCVGTGAVRPAMVMPRASGWLVTRATPRPWATVISCSPGHARSRTLHSRTAGLSSASCSDSRTGRVDHRRRPAFRSPAHRRIQCPARLGAVATQRPQLHVVVAAVESPKEQLIRSLARPLRQDTASHR